VSIFNDIAKVGKGILGTVAPVLAGALPGPMGALAKKIVTDLLGLDQDTPNEEIEKALAAASPETLIKLREIDAKFKTDMEQIGVDLERIAVDDRKSARDRNVALKDRTPAALAWLVVSAWIGVTVFLFCCDIPQANREIIFRALGTMDGVLMLVMAFYFGSSSGSAKKSDTIARLTETDLGQK